MDFGPTAYIYTVSSWLSDFPVDPTANRVCYTWPNIAVECYIANTQPKFDFISLCMVLLYIADYRTCESVSTVV